MKKKKRLLLTLSSIERYPYGEAQWKGKQKKEKKNARSSPLEQVRGRGSIRFGAKLKRNLGEKEKKKEREKKEATPNFLDPPTKPKGTAEGRKKEREGRRGKGKNASLAILIPSAPLASSRSTVMKTMEGKRRRGEKKALSLFPCSSDLAQVVLREKKKKKGKRRRPGCPFLPLSAFGVVDLQKEDRGKEKKKEEGKKKMSSMLPRSGRTR